MIKSQRLGRAGVANSSTPEASEFLAALAIPFQTALDPACGTGGTLLKLGAGGSRSVVGFDIDRTALRRAEQRLQLAGIEANLRTADWLKQDLSVKFQSIVADFPFGLKYTEDALPERYRISDGDAIWLLRTSEQLAPGGRAVLMSTAGSTRRSGQMGRARNALVEMDMVRAVISMPAGTKTGSSSSPTVWVLGEPSRPEQRNYILLANLASYDLADDKQRISLTQEQIRDWLETGRAPRMEPWISRIVHSRELFDSDLTPANYLEIAPPIDRPRPEAPGRLLTELRIENIKAINESVAIPLRPLTLIYGKNSAGKSTILQSLLLAKQSAQAGNLTPTGPLADLGSLRSLTHRGDLSRPVSVGFSFASAPTIDGEGIVPDPSRIRSVDWSFGVNPRLGLESVLTARVGLGNENFLWRSASPDENIRDIRDSLFSLDLGEVSSLIDLTSDPSTDIPPSTRKNSSRPADASRRVVNFLDRGGWGSLPFERNGLLPSSVHSSIMLRLDDYPSRTRYGDLLFHFRNAEKFLQAISDEVFNTFSRMVYLGPLRKAPERVSRRTSSDTLDLPFFLLDNVSEQKAISRKLTSLGVPYQLSVASISERANLGALGDLASIILTDERTGVELSTADVGFGISQVLPIVTELSARSNSVILIEQPEIHLHPAMQGDLADLMIESSHSAGNANQIVVETHSENLILRVQRRIQEGTLDSTDVAVIYVGQHPEGHAIIQELRLDEAGQFIDSWPNGFFMERVDDLFGGLL